MKWINSNAKNAYFAQIHVIKANARVNSTFALEMRFLNKTNICEANRSIAFTTHPFSDLKRRPPARTAAANARPHEPLRKRRRVGVRGAALAKRTNRTRARKSNAFGALCAFAVLLSCDLCKLSSSNALNLCKISSLRDARRNCFERSLFSHAKSHKLVSTLLCKFISVWNSNKHSFLLKLSQYI